MNKSFEYKLKKNVWYTIRVTKEEYIPLLISFNTELGNDATLLDNLFRFETALIYLEEVKSMNKDLIDFPVGIVAYNKETQKFEAKDIYTSNNIAKLNNEQELPTDMAKLYKSESQADIAKECISKNNA